MLSLRYNNGSSISYVNNGLYRGINNNTQVDYGRSLWIFYNGTPSTTSALGNETYNVGLW